MKNMVTQNNTTKFDEMNTLKTKINLNYKDSVRTAQ